MKTHRRRPPITVLTNDTDPNFAVRVCTEHDAVLSSAVFQRSPVLSGLLRYLVNETIAGRASTLKSFIVAVDALGRKQDFDSASDSSARVQMGRLRKALESYYADNSPSDGACIYLLPSSYIVRLDSREIAYPALQPLYAEPEIPVIDAPLPPISPKIPVAKAIPFYRRAFVLPLAILCIIGIIATAAYFAQSKPDATLVYRSPILEIVPIDSGDDPAAEETSRLIASLLADDLSRFKLSRVRLSNGSPLDKEPNGITHLYRLYSRLVTDKDNKVTLYLNIDDAKADVLIWSRIVIMPADAQKTHRALVPVVAEINGPQGIIASYEAMQVRKRTDGGYPCLLRYFEFARFRSDILEEKVAACLNKPVVEPSIQGTMLGVRALFETEREDAAKNLDAAYARGIIFARAAVKADPNDGWANFAFARLSYLKRDCPTARFYTSRTMEANPNSPVFAAVLSGLAPICNYPYSEKLLDQAILTQSPYFPKARLQLILGAIAQNRLEKIDEIYAAELPLLRENHSSFYLAEAMIAASKGQRSEATGYWELFETSTPPQSKTADEKLRHFIMIPSMRQQVIRYLQDSGVAVT
jgi:hypothetical protein